MIPRERILSKLDLLLKANDYQEGKRLLQYWLSEAEQTGDDAGILLMQNELMGLCRKLGEGEQALAFAQNALLQTKKMGIADNIGAATTYLNSATVYKAFGMAQDGIPLFEKAQKIYEQNLASNDTRLAGLYNNMALALVDLCRFDEAKELYQKALFVLSMSPSTEPEQAITYLNIASAAEAEYGLDGGKTIILENLNAAKNLLDTCQNQTDGNYAFVCEKCASVFGYYGYTDYALQLKDRCRRIYEGT